MKKISLLVVGVLMAILLVMGAAAFTAEDVQAGDINGDGACNILDALTILRSVLNGHELPRGDLNGDGKVGLFDVIRAMRLMTVDTYTVYTVTFVDHDGTVLELQLLKDGEKIKYPTDPTRENHRFTGWDKTVITATEDVTVTAQYIRQYTVTFVDHDGTELYTQTVDAGAAATAPTVPNSLVGYKFSGWDRSFGEVTSDLTVTAQYEINEYEVTLLAHDGKPLDTQKVQHGSRFTPIAHSDAFPEMYFDWEKKVMRCFSGWSVTNPITENTEVTALYNTLYDAPVLAAMRNVADCKVDVYIYMPDGYALYGINWALSWEKTTGIGVIGYEVLEAAGNLYTGCDKCFTWNDDTDGNSYRNWKVEYNKIAKSFTYAWACPRGHAVPQKNFYSVASIEFQVADGTEMGEAQVVFTENCNLIYGRGADLSPTNLVSVRPMTVIK